jgi:hypothetical protein
MLNSLSRVQLETLTLWYLVQHSLSSFYKISQHYSSLTTAIQPDQVPTWQALGIHANHVQRLKDFSLPESQQKFQRCLEKVQRDSDFASCSIMICTIRSNSATM